MSNKSKRLIVVLGMHRSGTSTVIRGLMALGVSLGDHLLPAMPENNEKGFWEDLDIYELNVEILSAIGRNWDSNIPITESELKGDILAPFRPRAVELIRNKIEHVSIFGIKEPRFCRLLPFWKAIFHHLKLDVSYVITIRNPMSVAQSLRRRDRFEVEKSYYLWMGHVLPSITETEGCSRIVVNYDLLMDKPEAQLLRIADRLNLSLGMEFSDELEDFRKNYLDKGLRHTRFRMGDLKIDPTIPKGVVDSYSLLHRLAEDELPIDSSEVQSSFAELTQDLEKITPALRNMTVVDELVSSLEQKVADRDKQIAELSDSLESVIVDRDAKVAGYESIIVDRDAKRNEIINLRKQLVAKHGSSIWLILALLRRLKRRLVTARKNAYLEEGQPNDSATVVDRASEITNDLDDTLIEQKTSERRPSGRILLVSHYCPTRAHGGGLRILDIYALIRKMCPEIQLDLFTHHRPDIDWEIDDIYDIFNNVYLSPTEELSPKNLEALAGKLSTYHIIDLQFHPCGYQIDAYRDMGDKIIYTPMESLSRALYLELRNSPLVKNIFPLRKIAASVRNAAEEIFFLPKVDEVVCVSKSDAAFLRATTSLRHIRRIDTGISQFEFSEALASDYTVSPASMRPCKILYIAYFGSQTNLDALRWYLENVHPQIKDKVPDYSLTVVGRGDLSTFAKYHDSSIEFVGEVPALAPYIQEARVGIAPAISGSGFRGKVNQYSVMGVPSVVSLIAYKGLSYKTGVDIYVAESPQDFADRCIRLLNDTDLNDRMGRAARELCMDRYTWQSKWDAIKKVYKLEELA